SEIDADDLRHCFLSPFGFGCARAGSRGFFLANLDLDLAGLDLFQLRQPDLEDAIVIARPDLLRLHRDGELDVTLERPRPALDPVIVLLPELRRDSTLPAEAQDVPGHGQVDVLLPDSGEFDRHDQVVAGLLDIEGRGPDPLQP